MEGFAVEEAADGVEAIQKIKDGAYDLILCDIKMPKADDWKLLVRQKPHAQMLLI